jgi:hypothetical protein
VTPPLLQKAADESPASGTPIIHVGHYGTRRGLAAFCLGALWAVGLLGARGIRLSWSALRGKGPCYVGKTDSLGVVALASIDAGKRKPGLVARFIDSGKRNLDSSPKASGCFQWVSSRFGLAYGAEGSEGRNQSKQQADRGLPRSSFRGGAGDLVLSRCCIYCLLPVAYCLVHAACNKSARAGATAAGGRWQARSAAQAAEMQR